MLLRHQHHKRRRRLFLAWTTELLSAPVASAFLHPISCHTRHLSSTPTSKIIVLSSLPIDDDSNNTKQLMSGFDEDANVRVKSSSSAKSSSSEKSVDTIVLEKESFLSSSAVEKIMTDAVSFNDLNTNINVSTGKDAVLSRWERRLNTFEDAFSIHKLSAVVYTISSFTLVGTAAYRWLIGRQELFATVPDYLEPVMWAFCISNFFMCAASIRMALLYRSNNVASRNAFIGVAGSSLFSAYFLVWASPFAPEQMIAPLASQIGFGILCAWNIILILDTMIRASDIIDDRRDTRSQEENASYGLEYIRYIFSAAWPLPVIVSTGYINAVLYDHGWLISVFDQVLQKGDFGLQASVFYNNVGGSMAASYAAFFITLRDKMLISKKAEWIGILVFSLPILIWTGDVSARIFPYVLGILQVDQ
ncbi:hypothetical protein ACHAWT_010265 [Skeletonema menzelii]